jgi:hypothetical protein
MTELSQPGVHETNAKIERANQDILQGCRALLTEAGFPACFWPYATPCFCFHDNIAEDEYGDSAWKSRTGKPFHGLALPFGCRVFFWPAPTKYAQSKAAPRMQCGVFMGYRTSPGERWNGEYLVADLEDFVDKSLDIDADYSQFHIRPHITKQVKLGLDGVYFPLKQKYNWYNRTLAGRQAVTESEELFKPVKLDKPCNPNDAVDGVPKGIFATGDVVTMSDTEGFSLGGSVSPDAAVPDNPPSIDPAGSEETVIHVWSA